MKFEYSAIMQILELSYKFLAVFDRDEKEVVENKVRSTLFPADNSTDKAWDLEDASCRMHAARPFHVVVIDISASPGSWQKNLLLLFVREKLQLVDAYEVQSRHYNMQLPKLKERLEDLEQIIPKKRMLSYNVPTVGYT